MREPLLIVNPACGARGSASALSRVLAAAEKALGDVIVRYTARRGHARELALEGAREGHGLIVAVGGDGTFSEVVNGVLMAGDGAPGTGPPAQAGTVRAGAETMAAEGGPSVAKTPAAESPAVGLINLGTGGDFRRTLGIGPDFTACLEALTLGRERTIDVGRASFRAPDGSAVEQYFVNVLSAGLGGLVDRYIETVPAFLGGTLGYYLASLRAVTVAKERPLLARITWDGETREQLIPAYLVAICNGRWFGGGMDIAPMALPDDGRLEVLTITERNKLYLAGKVRKVYTGRHLEEATVHHFPCRRIELRLQDETAERRYLLDVDGDPLGSLPLTVEVVPGKLRVRA
jgi:diacylglycerol kinase (ATP)